MKYDFFGQLIFGSLLVVISLFSIIPGNGAYFLLAILGLLPLGIWQVISDAINSFKFKNDKQKFRYLKLYWLAAAAAFILFIISINVSPLFQNQKAMVGNFVFVAMAGLVLVAIFYLFIYKKYLLKNEQQEDISTGSIH